MGHSTLAGTDPKAARSLPWLRVLRPQFVIVAVIPVAAGLLITSLAAPVDGWTASLTLTGGILFLLATNLVDEAWDYLQHRATAPFAGGSGVIQQGLLAPRAVLRAGQVLFGVCALGGLYLTLLTGWLTGLFTLIGLFCGYYYAAPPIRFGYRGLGELFCATAMGLILTVGTVYIQLGQIPFLAWTAAVPIAATVAFILFAKSIPDIEQDRENEKWTLALRLGYTGSLRLYACWMLAVLAVNGLLAGLGLLPATLWALQLFLIPWIGLAPRAWQGERAPAWLERLGQLSLLLYGANGALLVAGLYFWQL